MLATLGLGCERHEWQLMRVYSLAVWRDEQDADVCSKLGATTRLETIATYLYNTRWPTITITYHAHRALR